MMVDNLDSSRLQIYATFNFFAKSVTIVRNNLKVQLDFYGKQ